jgi:DNA-binding response OmpR family regulator
MLETCKKILCIEDDRETAALIAEEIAERGYDVHVAFDGSEGFSAILKLMPDLVLLDISMPVMSGFELLERLTGFAPQFGRMPVVFVTAMTDRDIELKGRELGAADFVTKPIDFDMLGTIIEARLAGVARDEF